jgi:hypothetical protein
MMKRKIKEGKKTRRLHGKRWVMSETPKERAPHLRGEEQSMGIY